MKKTISGPRCILAFMTLIGGMLLFIGHPALAEAAAFTVNITDTEGMQTEVQKARLYWEEQVSETTFVPHEVTYVPVKRGTSTIKVKFANIKSIEVKKGTSPEDLPQLHITLKNGKTGKFSLAVDASFVGDSDFGEVNLPVKSIRKVDFQ